MIEQTFNLKGGVLIIGSLLWQDYVRRKSNTIRLDWRNNHLELKSAIGVKTPIRYGRISGGGVYTMTFANSCRGKNLGTGFVVPFRNNPITNFTQLRDEARELARAEGMDRTFISSIDRNPWCVLGILFNKKKKSKANITAVSNWWEKQLIQDEDYSRFQSADFGLGKEKTCILSNGVLNIPWVVPIKSQDKKELGEYDFVIATATLPTRDKYPSIKKLVSAVERDTDRRYFLRNYERGITTFQDERVNAKLKSSKTHTDHLGRIVNK
ncbi:MAG TPA: hypothetical protein VF556_16875 [Pyrinomonadaceae bacterium]|jgi:hypothetical protein